VEAFAEDPDAFALKAYARSRSESDFAGLYERHSPYLLRFVRRFLGASAARDSSDAEDVHQEVWIRVASRASTFEGRARVRTWITGIAINCCREALRRRARGGADPPEDGSDPEDLAPSANVGAILDLEAAVAALPRRSREVFLLVDVHGYTHREAADLLGIAEGTSKRQLFDARRQIRARLTTEDGRGERTKDETENANVVNG
jgi:RNA polymerase sigma-70 factor (ECF subfamily)